MFFQAISADIIERSAIPTFLYNIGSQELYEADTVVDLCGSNTITVLGTGLPGPQVY